MSQRSTKLFHDWSRPRVLRESIVARLIIGLGTFVFLLGLMLFVHALVRETDSFPSYSLGVVASALMTGGWRGILCRIWSPYVEKSAILFFGGLVVTFIGLRLGIHRELNAAFTPVVLGAVLIVSALLRLCHRDDA